MFLSELVPDLLMEVPNLTDVQAMRAIQRAARRFYSETLLWEEQRTYSVSEGTSVVRFLLPIDECSIIAVKRAYFEGDELLPMREPEFMQATELPAAPQPLGYLPKLSAMTALVAPIASVRQDNSYDFTLILAPSMDADELPLDAYSQFEDAYVAELTHFLDVLEGAPSRACTPAEALEALYIAEAANRSLASGAPILIADLKN